MVASLVFQDLQRETEDALQSREDMANALKDNEKKIKNLEADLAQLQEDLAASERARKSLQAERDELQEELTAAGSRLVSLARLCDVFVVKLVVSVCNGGLLLQRYQFGGEEAIGGTHCGARRRIGGGSQQFGVVCRESSQASAASGTAHRRPQR